MSSTTSITPLASRFPAVRSRLGIPTALLILALVSFSTLDLPLSRQATHDHWPDEIHKALDSVEPFGNIYGMTVILLALLAGTPRSAAVACRIGVAGLSGGLSAGLIKLFVARTRPHHFDFDHSTILDSFQGLVPLVSRGGGWQSFPSAHTAMAAAFAVALARQFPRTRWLCYALAAMVGLQRVESGQHFASDVLVGAAVGWTVATLVLALWKSQERSAHPHSEAQPIPTAASDS